MATLRAMPIFLCPLMLCLAGCSGSSKSPATGDIEMTETIQLETGPVRVSGPYTHGNLSVFLLHAEKQDQRSFLTLEDGLSQGQVKISEREQETVQELMVDNTSDRPLFLQEGERLYGGKQDRIIAASLVLPPRSGKVGVATYCIEQSRWVEGEHGRKFVGTANTALAPKGVRGAAKFEQSQDGVWTTVAAQKDSAAKQELATNKNSSANELLDAPKLRDISSEYATALIDAIHDHTDAIGVAVVVNGQIEEINLYPNHDVLSKFFPRLVQSYAIQAELLKVTNPKMETTTAADVAALLTSGKELSKRNKAINGENDAVVRELEGHKHVSCTRYQGQAVHWQMMKQNRIDNAPARMTLGSKW